MKKIDHVGIAVHSLEDVKMVMKSVFGLEPHFEETVTDQKVKVVGFKVGESNLEFLEPLNEESPIAKYLGCSYKYHRQGNDVTMTFYKD